MASNHNKVKAHLRVVVAILFLFIAVVSSAEATLLDLQFQDVPDIYSEALTVSYDASSRTFSAVGSATHYYHDPTDINSYLPISNGIFSLVGVLDSSNKPSGTLSISGLIGGTGSATTLLAGELFDFGYGDAGGIWQFLFTTTDSDLAGVYGLVGAVELGGLDFVDLSTNIENSAGAFSDTKVPVAPVPEPSTLLLVAGGVGLAIAASRRKAMK